MDHSPYHSSSHCFSNNLSSVYTPSIKQTEAYKSLILKHQNSKDFLFLYTNTPFNQYLLALNKMGFRLPIIKRASSVGAKLASTKAMDVPKGGLTIPCSEDAFLSSLNGC
ncbi:hypothetical protein L6164_025259 [Bauhinia variegata]|uniref:Uncharacterized protein n=1 Tax=Bauhinia variegata TaxID=167791 RepID=A0ACB9M1F1_BAUVA|nr:hypothetical protein L6164_025259 [Bauhinia variegata]